MGLICVLNFDLLRGPGGGGGSGDPSSGGGDGGISPTEPIEDLLEEIRRRVKNAVCAVADKVKGESLRVGVDLSIYLGAGIRVGTGLTYNESTGQFVWDKYFGGGMGLGANAGIGLSTSGSIAEPGRRANLDINGDVGLGIISGGYTNNLSTIEGGVRSEGTGGSTSVGLTRYSLGGAASLNMTAQDNTEVGPSIRCEG